MLTDANTWGPWVGYLAAVLVFAAFYTRTMVPLRWTAISSNVAFIIYAAALRLWPILILHALLLPLNLIRLRQIYRMVASIQTATANDLDAEQVLAHMSREQHPAGAVLFKKGDPADCAYYLSEGEIEIPERNVLLRRGNFFGEIAIFIPSRSRTASARCASSVILYRISRDDLLAAFYQKPALAMALMQLVAGRLAEDLEQAEQAGR